MSVVGAIALGFFGVFILFMAEKFKKRFKVPENIHQQQTPADQQLRLILKYNQGFIRHMNELFIISLNP